MSNGSFDELFSAAARDELRDALAERDGPITLPQLRRLAEHAESLRPELQPLRLGIVRSYTSELLDPWLSLEGALNGLQLHTYHAPYGCIIQEAEEGSGLLGHGPDVTLLMLERSDLHPALSEPIGSYSFEQQRVLHSEVIERLFDIVRRFRRHDIGYIVLTLLPSMHRPGLGMYDAQSDRSASAWWAGLKAEIARAMREDVPASFFLDLDLLLEQVGRTNFFDWRLWYSARYPFSAEAARGLARHVASVGVALKLPKAKVIAVDADNTLWGGIIGEDGINGIALGPDYPGNAYVDFQRRLLEYRQRGFILVLCSKNNPRDVQEVLREHPHQLIREHHFAAMRVNWLPKPDNLVSLANELNLGLESFIVVDDSDYECAGLRHSLPQVEVVRTPGKPILVARCLEQVARLETLAVTAEDVAKTELYAQERERLERKQEIEQSGGDLRAYLTSLDMRMRVGFDDERHARRLAQLTQKTNQFNLTTRRYDEQRIRDFIDAPDWLVAHFSLQDIFGDSGVVGLALLRRVRADAVDVDTFLMSCRVIGREAEGAFLHCLLRRLFEQGVWEITAEYLPTEKNVLAADFLVQQGFDREDGGRHRIDLRESSPRPESEFPIAVEVAPSDRGD